MRFKKHPPVPAADGTLTELARRLLALEAENALLRADNDTLRQKGAAAVASGERLMAELGKLRIEHHLDSGEVRSGPFFDVMGFDDVRGLPTLMEG